MSRTDSRPALASRASRRANSLALTGLTIHAVEFALSARDGRLFDCVPEASKGRFLQTNAAASLKDALGIAVAEATAPPAPSPKDVLTPATLTVPASLFAGAQFFVGWLGSRMIGGQFTITDLYE